jgi:hypothetical protein
MALITPEVTHDIQPLKRKSPSFVSRLFNADGHLIPFKK